MKVYKGIPALAPLAEKIAAELDIPDFDGQIFPETGTARPRGWGLIGRYSGRRLYPVRRKKKTVKS
jgi:hypothetical protein